MSRSSFKSVLSCQFVQDQVEVGFGGHRIGAESAYPSERNL
jgi:hypothetical protein